MRADRAQAPQAEDYTKDGILYCGKCHTPKRAIANVLGEDKLVGIMCSCKKAEYEADCMQQERDKRYFNVMQRVERYDLGVKGHKEFCHPRVLQYLDNWDAMRSAGTGLLLWGDVGTGKTTSAAYLVNTLKKRHIPALITNFAQFGDVTEKLPSFDGLDLLVLDDLGAERQSEFMLERVFEIVDRRTRKAKPTIYTTNLLLNELKKPKDLTYKRLYSRILERTVPIKFVGIDHREENQRETIEQVKKLFEE